jgi:2',3'-cyclic-nucleotide 2'-phosphodiesterase (5'-nucleotidase family)
MVATLRAVGVTHVSLGNHEADLRLNKLKRRLDELGKSATILNTNILPCDKAPWLRASSNSSIMDNSSKNSLFEYSILSTKCERARVKLVGLMSDEPNMFRDNTFRGAEIENVIDAWDRVYNYQNDSAIPDNNLPVVALTHQTIHRDKELARHMVNYGNSLIIGGHEHEPFDIIVEDDQDSPQHQIRILKSGMDASACHAIDIEFDNDTQQIASIDAKLELLSSYEPSIVVQKIVDQHQSLLTVMENEVIIHAQNLLPPGVLLSSVGTRYRQTTVGAVLCTAIKEQLEVDVAMINGAPIKGNRDYPDGKMSFAELKKELPFPTKMVVVTMKRWQLHEAIHYSRKHPPEPEDRDSQTLFERRGYLQVDVEFDRLGFHTGGQDDILKVALPRNLMKGFCDIEPLVHFGSALKAKGEFPVEDDHVQAMDLVINHFCREAWYEIVRDNLTFDDLDIDHKGFLTRDDGTCEQVALPVVG